MGPLFVLLCISWMTGIAEIDGACSFSSHLSGAFEESSKGVLTFTTNQVSSYALSTFGTFTFDCHAKYSTTQYILKSSTTISYFSLNWDAYMCWDITEVSSNTFYIYEATPKLADAGGERVKMYFNGASPTYADICATSSYTAGTYRFLMRNDTISTSKIACPSQLENYWAYTIDTGSGDVCASNDTQLNACTDTSALTFNYTLCSTNVVYSSGGTVYCLHTLTSGSLTYLTTYNMDNTVDGSSTYRFTCLVLDLSNSNSIAATQHPQSCQSSQNSTYVASPGASLQFTFGTTCAGPTTMPPPVVLPASLDWIAAVLFGCLLILGLIIASYIFCCYNYKKYLNEQEREIIENRGIGNMDFRAEPEVIPERGQAPPNIKFTFPDYTMRSLGKLKRKWKTEKPKHEKEYEDRPLSPSGISFRDSESPDSALGMDEEDGYPALRSQKTRPVSDFMKRLINLHDDQREKEKERARVPEEKRFKQIHGRQGFKNESDIKDSAGLNLVSKIKKMARRRRKTNVAGDHSNTVDPARPDVVQQNEANDVVDSRQLEGSEVDEDSVPSQLDVSQLLAYTAMPPNLTELPREIKRSRTVSIAPRNASFNEDLERRKSNQVVESPKVFTVGDRAVTPNMKFRKEPFVPVVRNASQLARIHRKIPVTQAVPDIEVAPGVSGTGLSRSVRAGDWGKYLEEIYPDKLYFDYAKATSIKSETHLRDTADKGLDYLYGRDLFWKKSEQLGNTPLRVKSTRSIRTRVRSADNTTAVSRSTSMKDPASCKDVSL